MNKAITDGVQLMPPAFANGLDVWSSGDGTPGSDTYDGAANAAFVPADADFSGCLEVQKSETLQKLRYTGETPLLPGCYLRITARVKAISGNLPAVRIAAWPGRAGGVELTGVVTTGPSTTLTQYGEVVEVSAIVGAGNRGGVDMVWGPDAIYGHFGLDLTGQNGGILRIDDLIIEDITSAFLRDVQATVDVRDYGAVGDGATDDSAAFDAANADANGRMVLIPEGTFHLGQDVTFDAPTRFEGKVTMPVDKILLLRGNFHYPAYLEAFEDEELAFKKGFQALLNNADHESFDLCGRKIRVSAEIDMQAAVPNRTSYATRRVIRNGQLEARDSNWDTRTTSSQATYTPSNPHTLSNVTNVASIEVGSLVTGAGVGREIYVRAKNVAAQQITLSAPLFDAAGTQTYTFHRFQYLVNFSGFSLLSKFVFDAVEFQCSGDASAILLAPSGSTFELMDCFITRPKDRGISSIGEGCQGMLIDRCQFLSAEDAEAVSDRVSVALNANANDLKLRNNRSTRFRHFAVLGGANNIIIGNHFFQGDTVADGVRTAGVVLTSALCSTLIVGNYVDNCFIEWSNESDPTPEFTGGFSFSALSITDNIFLSGDVAPWFNYIVVKPHGVGNFLNGMSVDNNRFRSINGTIDRVEGVDTTHADLDHTRNKDVSFSGNSFHNITEQPENPLRVAHVQNTAAAQWTIEAGGRLPFGGHALSCDAIVPTDAIRTAGNAVRWSFPHVDVAQGADGDQVRLNWNEAVKGAVQVVLRMDQ